MPCKASSGPYGGQSAPGGVSLYGADCTRHDQAGAKSTEENGAVCCQHEKKRHGCATQSGAADRALHRLVSGAGRRIWMCMRVRLAPAACHVVTLLIAFLRHLTALFFFFFFFHSAIRV